MRNKADRTRVPSVDDGAWQIQNKSIQEHCFPFHGNTSQFALKFNDLVVSSGSLCRDMCIQACTDVGKMRVTTMTSQFECSLYRAVYWIVSGSLFPKKNRELHSHDAAFRQGERLLVVGSLGRNSLSTHIIFSVYFTRKKSAVS